MFRFPWTDVSVMCESLYPSLVGIKRIVIAMVFWQQGLFKKFNSYQFPLK